MAYIYAYESDHERDHLVKELGDTLLKMRNVSAAIVCYILSHSVDQVLDLWRQRALFQISKQEKTREQALFDLFERYILFKISIDSSNNDRRSSFDQNTHYNATLVEISRYLTSQAETAILALKYLSFTSGPTHDVLCLKDRIYNSNFSTFNGSRVQRPIVPFQVQRLKVQIPHQQRNL